MKKLVRYFVSKSHKASGLEQDTSKVGCLSGLERAALAGVDFLVRHIPGSPKASPKNGSPKPLTPRGCQHEVLGRTLAKKPKKVLSLLERAALEAVADYTNYEKVLYRKKASDAGSGETDESFQLEVGQRPLEKLMTQLALKEQCQLWQHGAPHIEDLENSKQLLETHVQNLLFHGDEDDRASTSSRKFEETRDLEWLAKKHQVAVSHRRCDQPLGARELHWERQPPGQERNQTHRYSNVGTFSKVDLLSIRSPDGESTSSSSSVSSYQVEEISHQRSNSLTVGSPCSVALEPSFSTLQHSVVSEERMQEVTQMKGKSVTMSPDNEKLWERSGALPTVTKVEGKHESAYILLQQNSRKQSGQILETCQELDRRLQQLTSPEQPITESKGDECATSSRACMDVREQLFLMDAHCLAPSRGSLRNLPRAGSISCQPDELGYPRFDGCSQLKRGESRKLGLFSKRLEDGTPTQNSLIRMKTAEDVRTELRDMESNSAGAMRPDMDDVVYSCSKSFSEPQSQAVDAEDKDAMNMDSSMPRKRVAGELPGERYPKKPMLNDEELNKELCVLRKRIEEEVTKREEAEGELEKRRRLMGENPSQPPRWNQLERILSIIDSPRNESSTRSPRSCSPGTLEHRKSLRHSLGFGDEQLWLNGEMDEALKFEKEIESTKRGLAETKKDLDIANRRCFALEEEKYQLLQQVYPKLASTVPPMSNSSDSNRDALQMRLLEVVKALTKETAQRVTAECALEESIRRDEGNLQKVEDEHMRCVTTMKQKIGDLTTQLQLVEEHYKSKLVEQAQESQRKWDAQKADLYCEIEHLQDQLCSKDRQLNDLKLECLKLRQPVDLDNMQTLKSLEARALEFRAGTQKTSAVHEEFAGAVRVTTSAEIDRMRDAVKMQPEQLQDLKVKCCELDASYQELKDMERDYCMLKADHVDLMVCYEKVKCQLENQVEENQKLSQECKESCTALEVKSMMISDLQNKLEKSRQSFQCLSEATTELTNLSGLSLDNGSPAEAPLNFHEPKTQGIQGMENDLRKCHRTIEDLKRNLRHLQQWETLYQIQQKEMVMKAELLNTKEMELRCAKEVTAGLQDQIKELSNTCLYLQEIRQLFQQMQKEVGSKNEQVSIMEIIIRNLNDKLAGAERMLHRQSCAVTEKKIGPPLDGLQAKERTTQKQQQEIDAMELEIARMHRELAAKDRQVELLEKAVNELQSNRLSSSTLRELEEKGKKQREMEMEMNKLRDEKGEKQREMELEMNRLGDELLAMKAEKKTQKLEPVVTAIPEELKDKSLPSPSSRASVSGLRKLTEKLAPKVENLENLAKVQGVLQRNSSGRDNKMQEQELLGLQAELEAKMAQVHLLETTNATLHTKAAELEKKIEEQRKSWFPLEEELRKAREELKSKQTETEKLQEDLKEMKREVERRESIPYEGLKSLTDEQKIIELQKQLSTLKEGASMRHRGVERLQQEGERLKNLHQGSLEKERRLQEELRKKQAEIDRLEILLRKSEQEEEMLKEEFRKKQEEIALLESAQTNLNETEARDQEIQELVRQLKEMERQLSNVRDKLEEKERELQKLSTLQSDLQEKLKRREEQYEALKRTVKEKETKLIEMTKVKDEVVSKDKKLQEMQKEMTKMRDELTKREKKIQELQKDFQNMSRLKDQLKKREREIQELQREVETSERELEAKERDIAEMQKDMQDEIENLEHQLEMRESNIQELQMEIHGLVDEVETKKEKVHELEQDMSNLKEELKNGSWKEELAMKDKRLQEVQKEFQKEISKMEEDLTVKDRKLQELQKELQRNRDEMGSKEKRIQALQNEMQKELANLEEKLASKERELKEVQKDASKDMIRLREELGFKERKMQELQNKMSNRTDELGSKERRIQELQKEMQKEVSRLTDESSARERKVQALLKEMNNKKEEYVTRERQMQEKQKETQYELNKLRNEMLSKDTKMKVMQKDMQEDLERFQDELKTRERRMQDMEKEIDNLKDALGATEREMQEMQLLARSLQGQMEKKDKGIQTLELELYSAQVLLEKKTGELDGLQKRATALQERLGDVERKHQERDELVKKSQQEMHKVRRESIVKEEQLKVLYVEKERKISVQDYKLQNIEKVFKMTKEEMQTLQSTSHALETKLAEREVAFQEQTIVLSSMQEELYRMQQEMGTREEQFKDLEATHFQLQKALAERERKIQEQKLEEGKISREMAQKNLRIQEIQNEMNRVRQEFEVVNARLDTLQRAHTTLHAEYAVNEKKLHDQETEIAPMQIELLKMRQKLEIQEELNEEQLEILEKEHNELQKGLTERESHIQDKAQSIHKELTKMHAEWELVKEPRKHRDLSSQMLTIEELRSGWEVKMEEKEVEMSHMKHELERLVTELGNVTRQVEELRYIERQYDSLTEEYGKLTKKVENLTNMEQDYNQLLVELANMTKQVEKMSHMEQEYKAMMEELESKSRQVEELMKARKTIQIQLLDMEKQNKEQLRYCESERKQSASLEEYRNEIQEKDRKIFDMQKVMAHDIEKSKLQEEDLIHATKELARIKQAHEIEVAQRKAAENQFAELFQSEQQICRELQQDIEKKTDNLQFHIQGSKAMEKDIIEANKTIQDLKAKYGYLQEVEQVYRDLQKEIGVKKDQLESMEKTYKNLQEQYTKREKEYHDETASLLNALDKAEQEKTSREQLIENLSRDMKKLNQILERSKRVLAIKESLVKELEKELRKAKAGADVEAKISESKMIKNKTESFETPEKQMKINTLNLTKKPFDTSATGKDLDDFLDMRTQYWQLMEQWEQERNALENSLLRMRDKQKTWLDEKVTLVATLQHWENVAHKRGDQLKLSLQSNVKNTNAIQPLYRPKYCAARKTRHITSEENTKSDTKLARILCLEARLRDQWHLHGVMEGRIQELEKQLKSRVAELKRVRHDRDVVESTLERVRQKASDMKSELESQLAMLQENLVLSSIQLEDVTNQLKVIGDEKAMLKTSLAMKENSVDSGTRMATLLERVALDAQKLQDKTMNFLHKLTTTRVRWEENWGDSFLP